LRWHLPEELNEADELELSICMVIARSRPDGGEAVTYWATRHCGGPKAGFSPVFQLHAVRL